MRVQVAVLLAVAAASLAGASAPSGADPVAEAAPCTPAHVPHLGQACLRPDGLWDVVLASGQRLQTHGPDPLLPRDADGEVGWDDGAEQRPMVCASTWSMRVLYGFPAGQADRTAQVVEELRAALRRMNAVLNADALESGGVTADFRVLCDAGGDIHIATFSTPYTSGAAYTADFGQIVDGAQAAGHDDDKSDYLIFWDAGSSVCGVGNLASDDRLSPDNANMDGPSYGVVYDTCWDGRTPMHENGHTQGAVQDLAPDWDLTGHCLEGIDVMCYPTSDILVLCSDRVHYDCDHDTYFDAAPEDGEWLATHWNIGSPINRYIAFADTASPRSGTAAAAAAAQNATAAADNETAPASLAPSSTSSSSPTSRGTSTSARATTRSVPAPLSRAPAPGNASAGAFGDGQVTVEVPALPVALLAAAVVGGALLLRRIR